MSACSVLLGPPHFAWPALGSLSHNDVVVIFINLFAYLFVLKFRFPQYLRGSIGNSHLAKPQRYQASCCWWPAERPPLGLAYRLHPAPLTAHACPPCTCVRHYGKHGSKGQSLILWGYPALPLQLVVSADTTMQRPHSYHWTPVLCYSPSSWLVTVKLNVLAEVRGSQLEAVCTSAVQGSVSVSRRLCIHILWLAE